MRSGGAVREAPRGAVQTSLWKRFWSKGTSTTSSQSWCRHVQAMGDAGRPPAPTAWRRFPSFHCRKLIASRTARWLGLLGSLCGERGCGGRPFSVQCGGGRGKGRKDWRHLVSPAKAEGSHFRIIPSRHEVWGRRRFEKGPAGDSASVSWTLYFFLCV